MKKMLIILNLVFIALMIFFTIKVVTNNYNQAAVFWYAILSYLIEAVIFLYTILYIPEQTRKKIVKILKIYSTILLLILIVITLIQVITGWKFIYYFSYRYIIYAFLLYPAILKFYIQITTYYLHKSNLIIAAFTSFLVIALMSVNGLLVGFNIKQVSNITFDDSSYELILVDQSTWGGSYHKLYFKKNAFFVSDLQGDKYWNCNDYCVTGNPDAYNWEFLDEHRVKVSGGGLSEPIIYDLS